MSAQEHLVTPMNDEGEYLLETAANDVYEAVIDDVEDEDLDEDALYLKRELESHKSLHWLKRPSVISICIAIFLFTASNTVGAAAFQLVLYQLSCNSVAENGVCDPVRAQIVLSTYSQYEMILGGILPILASAKVGELSDKYGRKPFLSLIFSAYCLQKLLSYILVMKAVELPFIGLLACVMLGSIFGGVATIIALAQSYVTDVIEPHQRTFCIGLVSAAVMVGQGVGPAVAGLAVTLFGGSGEPNNKADYSIQNIGIDSKFGPSQLIPLRTELLITIMLSLYSIFIVPESRGKRARSKSRSSSVAVSALGVTERLRAIEQPSLLVQMGRLLNLLKPLTLLAYPSSIVPQSRKHNIVKYRIVVILLIVFGTIFVSTHMAFGQILLQYGIFRFNWGTTEIGYFITIVCVGASVMLTFGAPIMINTILQGYFGLTPLKRQLDLIDFFMIMWGRVVDIIAYSVLAAATSSAQIYGGCILVGLATPAGPAVTAGLLKFFPSSKTGEFFGAISLVQSFANIISTLMVMSMYRFGIRHSFPELVFVFYACLSFLYICVLLIVKKILRLTVETNDEQLIRSNSSLSLAPSDVSE